MSGVVAYIEHSALARIRAPFARKFARAGTGRATPGCGCAGLCPPMPLSRPAGSGRASARSEVFFTGVAWLIAVIGRIESVLNLFLCLRASLAAKDQVSSDERASDFRRGSARVRARPCSAAGAHRARTAARGTTGFDAAERPGGVPARARRTARPFPKLPYPHQTNRRGRRQRRRRRDRSEE